MTSKFTEIRLLFAGAMLAFSTLARPCAAFASELSGAHLAGNGKPYTEVAPNTQAGFNYPYLLFLPLSTKRGLPFLTVEPNNAGGVTADDASLTEARRAAIKVATGDSLGNLVAQRLGTPLLVPVFPRPPIGTDGDLDTYSLTRATLLNNSAKLRRPDLQLVAMIDDAQHKLRAAGHEIGSKILMTGFSGSGLFVNRFVFLHPDVVLAAAYGGLNSFIMLPVGRWKGHALNYPLGLADYKSLTGREFDNIAYAQVRQFAFMGANDDNDAIPNDDEYDPHDRDLVWELFGKRMLPDRWNGVQHVYATAGTSVLFKTYSEIGHDFDERALSDMTALFRAAVLAVACETKPCVRLATPQLSSRRSVVGIPCHPNPGFSSQCVHVH